MIEKDKLIEAVNDLKIHRVTWRNAICIAKESQHPDEYTFWNTELEIFDRIFKALLGEV
jgi:hypothetical protein